MSLQDPVADMLTRIRNAQCVNKKTVQVRFSNLKQAIAEILTAEGYLLGVQTIEVDGKATLLIALKYHLGVPVITEIKRASRPGLRLYRKKLDLPKVHNGMGVAVVSTSKGLMSDRAARAQGHGGEILCYVY